MQHEENGLRLQEVEKKRGAGNVWADLNNLIHKTYLDNLDQAVAVSDRTVEGHDFFKDCSCIQLDRVVKIVYDKSEDNLAKLNSVYSSLITAGQSVFVIVRRQNGCVEFFIGTRGEDNESAIAGRSILESAIRGNFPGVTTFETRDDDVSRLSEDISKKKCISIVTGVPDLKKGTEESFSQGLEKIIDAQGDKNFIALILATPLSEQRLQELEHGYQKIATQLSLMNVTQFSLSRQDTLSFAKSVGETVSESLSDSMSLAKTTSTSESKTKTPGQAIAATGAAAGAIVGSIIPGAGTAAGAVLGGAIGGAVGSIAGAFLGSTTKGTSNSETNTSTHTVSLSKTGTVTMSETLSRTEGTSTTYSVQDRQIADAMAIVDEQLKRIRMAKSYGAWRYAAYFLSDVATDAQTGANVFAGVLRGEQTGVERCTVSSWVSEQKQFKSIISDLSCLEHPRFTLGKDVSGKDIVVEPVSVITTQELAIGMSFPQKSLPGLPVFESVEFGRSVTTYDASSFDLPITIGAISHLGVKEPQKVCLDANSLTSHLFVTGSTGSGKSNFVYNLLKGIRTKTKSQIKFLVVEPAKGEYKDQFGGLSDVEVYGTNPRKFTKILRLNPFWFPDGIHIMEHIDRLVEILNAAWPMYAAMPAILKDAVEISYQREGWDLLRSSCRGGARRFPDFHDLLEVLPEVIGKSDYDTEVKNNYTGSLVTRVKSLTQGYYRTIFQKEELNEDDLFGKSCIVDISRVGSTETKSLLMGVVFMKLLEYRMTEEGVEANSGLRHITVLEEAHNLLRKTSMAQGMETANLAGKSVEMMTNAIAEMRTYGEGFVIADQAPGLLDEAVIRNTNTKVVFRLPDMDDRILVGKAENLNDEQIGELARLKTGCASVYQNNWQEAVLCQTELFSSIPNGQYDPHENHENYIDGRHRADEIFIRVLLGRISHNVDLRSLPECDRKYLDAYYSDSKIATEASLSDSVLLDELYVRFVRRALQKTKPIKDRPSWTRELITHIFSDDAISSLDPISKDVLLENVFKVLARYDTHVDQRAVWDAESADSQKWRLWR